MTLKTIIAHMECDGCGKAMQFDLDGADATDARSPSLMDIAIDECRGGYVRNLDGFASVQGESEQCLCPNCTSIVDAYVTEDRNATDGEIKEALDAVLLLAPVAGLERVG
jgi:hypothetical protein